MIIETGSSQVNANMTEKTVKEEKKRNKNRESEI